MPMNWWARVGIGAGLGLGTTLGSAFFLEGWMIPAAAGAAIAAIGFLATFFIFNPDIAPTPEYPEGYEQVLFDKPNIIASSALVVLMVSLAFFVRFDVDPGPDPAAYMAERDAMILDLEDFRILYEAQKAQYEAGTLAKADYQVALQAQVNDLRPMVERVETMEVPEQYADDFATLAEATVSLYQAFEARDFCLSDIEARCQTAVDKFEEGLAALDLLTAPPADAA